MDFYHDLAPFYDRMISFEKRLESEQLIFRALLDKYPAGSVLDAGCGSGFHSIVLSKLGLRVTGIDKSEDMLDLARANACKYETNPIFLQTDFLTVSENLSAGFDAVFCLGNSFVHLLTAKQQLQVLKNFKNLLVKKGYLCLQIVNYDKFLQEKKQELSVKKTADMTIRRTYQYHKRSVSFNVSVEKHGQSQTISTELYPLRSKELIRLMARAGFGDFRLYGSLNFDPYDPMKSENCCCFCL